MISRRRFLGNMFGVIAGAGLAGLPVWKSVAESQTVGHYVRSMMGTNVEIVLIGLDRGAAASAAELAFATMGAVAGHLTVFDPSSALSKFGTAAGTGPTRIGTDLEAVLRQAETIRSRAEGAFTPTILPLSRLWRPNQTRLPEAAAIEEAIENVARAAVVLPSSGWGEITATTQLDLGGIAKGYAVDQAVRTLRAAGVTSGIVDAGGDLRLLGSKDGHPWRIGIPDPSHPERIARILNVRDAAVATSGDYERFFVVDGVRYHHLVDPRTGYPARESRSFTVVLPDGMSADAVATAGFVLGPGSGLDFANRIGADALAVDSTGSWIRTDGLDDHGA